MMEIKAKKIYGVISASKSDKKKWRDIFISIMI